MKKTMVSLVIIALLLVSMNQSVFGYEENFLVKNKLESLNVSDYIIEKEEMNGYECDVICYRENGINKKVIKIYKEDGICDFYVYENGSLVSQISDFKNPLDIRARITYPYYTDYWYAGTDYYSTKIVNTNITTLATLIAAACGLPAGGAYTVAQTVYGFLDWYTNDNVYYTTARYYATLEYGPGQPTIYYTRFITKTYKNSNYTGQVGSAITQNYEGLNPL